MEYEVISKTGSNLGEESPTHIKVVGCGGGGGNAVNCMIDAEIKGVDFVALNTDLQALKRSKAEYKLQIGQKISGGLGAGGNPEVGEEAAKEEEEAIRNILKGSDMVFVTAGMGGGTGTGSAPIVARIARELGALTVAVVTTPFNFEGKLRMHQAEEGIKKLRASVDSLIVIPNQQVFKDMEKNLTVQNAFRIIDDILRQGVQGISDIITKPGLVNRDFNDVESVMKGQGDAILGTGIGKGENRAVDAATAAINNKLLENVRIDGAKNVLINICGNSGVRMAECDEIANIVTASANPDAKVLWGQVIDDSMEDTICVTVIATGFNKNTPEESETEEVVQKEEKTVEDSNHISVSDFNMLLSGKSSKSSMDSPELFEEEPSAQNDSLPGNISPDQYGTMTPKGKIDPDDINTPTVLRKKNGYSATINFNRR